MVQWERQDTFQEATSIDDGGLVVHAHRKRETRTLILLLHGFSGHGYKTWGILPEALFNDPELAVDVAVYDYRSGLRLLQGYRGGPRDWVDQVAGHLKELIEHYDHAILVGHSQGGVIAERAVAARLTADRLTRSSATNAESTTPPIVAGLILVGSPRAGSKWIPAKVARILPSTSLLPIFNDASVETDLFYSSYVERLNISSSPGRRFIVPSYACIGAGDRFVTEFSSTHQIPLDQRKKLSTTHVRIAKPRSKDAEIIRWIGGVVRDVLDGREQAQRLRVHELRNMGASGAAYPTVITELLPDPSGFEFEAIYRQQCADIARPGVTIVDAYDAKAGVVDVLMAAHDVHNFANRNAAVESNLETAYRRRREDSAHMVDICAIGGDDTTARAVLEQWIADKGLLSALYVNTLPDAERFRDHLARVLETAMARKLMSTRSRVISERDDYLSFEGGDS